MNALRVQGMVFSAIAIPVALVLSKSGSTENPTSLALLALLILLFGVPHGALDGIFAKELHHLRTPGAWAAFTMLYLLTVALVVCCWKLSPTLFLVGFLALSIAHFSGDPAPPTPVFSRILYGAAAVVLPILRHSAEVGRLFSFLAGPSAADLLIPVLAATSLPWLLALVIAALVATKRGDWLTGVEFLSVALLTTLAPPLIAFTLFFCGMHSARHILRTVEYSGRRSPRFLVASCALPMLTVGIAVAAAWLWLRDVAVDERVVQLLFVGLAGLTVPHMSLVERVRVAGWAPRKPAYPRTT